MTGDTASAGRPHGSAPSDERRLFVALPLPDAAVAEVIHIVESVRASSLPTGMRDVRWVRLDGLHLTLRFIGPTPEERLTAVVSAVRDAARSARPITGSLAGSGVFPTRGRPRTLWIGVASGVGSMTALTSAVNDALEAGGWARDDRPFKAHLTLARSDGLASGPIVADRLAVAMADRRIPFVADRIALYESQTGGGPARYVPLEVVDL